MRHLLIFIALYTISISASSGQCDAFIIIPGNHQFHIPTCEESINVVFSVQIIDYCEGISTNNITAFLDGDEINPTFSNLGSNGISAYLEYTETITPQNNNKLLLVTYTDSADNSIAVDGIITVTKNEDLLPALSCFPEINFSLNPDCGGTLLPAQVLGGHTGCLEASAINLTVYDSDSTNGPDIDEPGSHQYRISIPSLGYECQGIIHARGFGSAIACNDKDKDGITDVNDNCPNTPNSDQADSDRDGIGNACEKTAGNDLHAIENASGDIYIRNSARGLILRGYDDSCYRLTIDEYGNIHRTSVLCPR
ncbi:MAG: hypothetical protein HKN76_15605 [Saprospiraceae bacterium]|nr:hypothetical protein [Saprospiraceae bacterium]